MWFYNSSSKWIASPTNVAVWSQVLSYTCWRISVLWNLSRREVGTTSRPSGPPKNSAPVRQLKAYANNVCYRRTYICFFITNIMFKTDGVASEKRHHSATVHDSHPNEGRRVCLQHQCASKWSDVGLFHIQRGSAGAFADVKFVRLSVNIAPVGIVFP